MLIRNEEEMDRVAIREVNLSAFDSPAEADLVEALRVQATPLISLVADQLGQVVGHIMFSPVDTEPKSNILLMGLAPMSVVPSSQRVGIGSALVQAGIRACREKGVGGLVVLGHPAYYPRFGFRAASRFGIECVYDVPEGVFMAMELVPGAFKNISGEVYYHSAFGSSR